MNREKHGVPIPDPSEMKDKVKDYGNKALEMVNAGGASGAGATA